MENLFGNNEGNVNPAIPATAALLSALACTVAELDAEQEGERLAERFLDRMEWYVRNPSEKLPTLLLEQEQMLEAYRLLFRQTVEQTKDEFRMLNEFGQGRPRE